jgi:lysophospholipid acyltransferase (LPLAT)-like uncharacterized protein
MLKKIGRSKTVQSILSFVAVGYLNFVQATTRFIREPDDYAQRISDDLPAIIAMWHGQHLMVHFAWPKTFRLSALISRSGDGELNARIAERIGLRAIRGSGGQGKGFKIAKRGGAGALREMLQALEDGWTVALTADVPKISRIAGPGIVALAQMSGRPIYPVAVASSRRIDFSSWDHASIGLPFGRGAIIIGEPIRIARDASPEDAENTRQRVQKGLDEAHKRAYALLGSHDPGAARGAA